MLIKRLGAPSPGNLQMVPRASSTDAQAVAPSTGATAAYAGTASNRDLRTGLQKQAPPAERALALDLEPPPLPWLSVRANGPKN